MGPSLVSKPKPIFKGVVVAVAGDLGLEEWNDENLARYVRSHSGRFSTDFDDSVTHLVATKKQFEDNVQRVKEALKSPKVEIVSIDWIDDSILNEKKLYTTEYSFKETRKEANAMKRLQAKKAKGIKQGETFINTNLYHPYRDEAYFTYVITLRKGDSGERYVATLWESNAEPRLYHTGAIYYKAKHAKPAYWLPSKTPGSLERELIQFKKIFAVKTGVRWNDRMKAAEAGNGIVGKEGRFQYMPPTRGKPVGLINGEPRASSIFGNGNVDNGTVHAQDEPTSGLGTAGPAKPTIEEQVLTQVKDFVDPDKASPMAPKDGAGLFPGPGLVPNPGRVNIKAPAPLSKSGSQKKPSLAKKAIAAKKEAAAKEKEKEKETGQLNPEPGSRIISETSSPAVEQQEANPKPAPSKPASAMGGEHHADTEEDGSKDAMDMDPVGVEQAETVVVAAAAAAAPPVVDKAAAIQDMVDMQIDEACQLAEESKDDDMGYESDDSGYGAN